MTPELWTRCLNALAEPYDYGPDPKTGEPVAGFDWWCDCHGDGQETLVEVPFDEAVQRMEAEWDRLAAIENGESVFTSRELWGYLLRAALGEDTE